MEKIICNCFSGKDGRKWVNCVFIKELSVLQFFGEFDKLPVDYEELLNGVYTLHSVSTNGRYGVCSLVAESTGAVSTVFCKVII